MKFGKQLEAEALERFRGFYIQYKELKKALKVFTGQERDQATVQEVTHWTSSFLRLGPNPEVPPEAKLNDILESELKRVSKCTALQEEGLRSELARLEEAAAAAEGDEERAALRPKLEELGEQLVQLKSFAQLNFTGFRKILKKYDKWSKSAVLTWFMGKVMRAPLMGVDFEGHLLKLNSIALALAEGPEGTAPAPPAGAADGLADSAQLLVQPKATMWVKVQLALHLRLAPAAAAAASGSATAAATRPARPRRSSYYFDTRDFSVYGACIADGGEQPSESPPCALLHLRDDGVDAVRLVRTSKGGTAAVEVPLTRAEATQLVGGQYVATPAAARSPLGAGTVTAEAVLGEFRAAAARGLSPVAMSSSRRSAFRAEASPLTAALEEDIKLARAQEWGGPPGPWEFLPYNVLHITCSPEDPPRWLSRIYDSPNVMQVSGFSLALHAVARCCARGSALPLPHWYRSLLEGTDEEEKQSEDFSDSLQPKPKPSSTGTAVRSTIEEIGEQEPASPTWKSSTGAGARLLHEFGPEPMEPGPQPEEDEESAPAAGGGLDAPLLARPAAAGSAKTRGLLDFLFGQRSIPEPAPQGLPVRQAIVTVQPKTLYSNERTFLEWIHFATIFAALGIGLMHGASEKASSSRIGRWFVALAVLLILWAQNTFTWRADALDKKEIRSYHDPIGPPLLILGMIVMLLLSCMVALELI